MNNKTPTYREKGRAVFLAAIMVLSVVAISATAFTGAVAAQNANDFQEHALSDGGEVVVEGVSTDGTASENYQVVATYPNSSGTPVVAGFTTVGENFGPANVAVLVEDPAGFPGNHTAHIVDTNTVNIGEAVGDGAGFGLSDVENSYGPSAIYNGDVSVDDQLREEGVDNDEVEVASSLLDPNSESGTNAEEGYVIAIHNSSAGSPGPIIGTSSVINSDSTQSNIVIDLDTGEALNVGATDITAMLHYADTSNPDNLGAAIPQAVNDTSPGFTPVTDTATIYVEEDADNRNLIDGSISDTQLNPIQRAENVTFNITYVGGTGSVASDIPLVVNTNVSEFQNLGVPIGDASFVDRGPGTIDEYYINLPNFGSGSRYEIRANLTGFKAFDGTTEALDPGDQDRQDVRLERRVFPEDINVDQNGKFSATANFDGTSGDTIVFDVEVIGDDGNPYSGADVTVTHDGDANSINFVDPNAGWTNDVTNTTDADGMTRFEVGSNTSQTVNFNFTVDPVDPDGSQVFEVRTKDFVLAGEGYIEGYVQAADQPQPENSLEGAQVWAVQRDTFLTQSEPVPTPNTAGDTLFYRLVDNQTGEILDVDEDYRIDNDGQNSALQISRVEDLNTTDASVGSGWAVRATASSPTDMFVTPLEASAPGEYRLEVSDTAPNASDTRFTDPANPSESFGIDHNFTTTEDLDYDSAVARSSASGQTLNDTTDQDGQYILQDMFTDFQNGVEYTVMADHPGYDTRFGDALVTEDGAFFEERPDNDFVLFPVELDPGFVDITNFGLHPPLSQTGGAPDPSAIVPYANQTDAFNQSVPRDASVDVITVETRSEEGGTLLNSTVDLSVPDDDQTATPNEELNFTGQILGVVGGEIVSQDDGDAGTFHTGDVESIGNFNLGEGEAIVLLESDESESTLRRTDTVDNSGVNQPPTNQTGIFAQLEEDASATDFTRKEFPGVLVFQSGSISGDITNDDELLPNTFVWTAEFFSEGGTKFTIDPNFTASPVSGLDDIDDNSDVDSLVFDITVQDPTGSVVDSAQATGDELQSINLGAKLSTVSQASVNEFNLLRSNENHQNGDYSMDQVPAQDDGTLNAGVDYRRLSAAQYDTGDRGNGSTSTPVRTGFTVEGNVVITGAQPIDTSPSVADYANANGVVDTPGLQEAIDDWQNGEISTSLLRDVIDAWQSGEVVT
jgi:surface glycoprotein (TIGR04207 family)